MLLNIYVMKQCKKCLRNLEYSNFYQADDCPNGRNICKECIKKYGKKYYSDNKGKVLANNKSYRDLYVENIKKKRKEYYEKNREILTLKQRERLESMDIISKSKLSIITSIRSSYYRMGYKFPGNIEDIIGLDILEFTNYIESKFLPGMSWDNRSEWHIDHIIPVSVATNITEVNKLNHYSNLLPIWKTKNLIKSGNIPLEKLLEIIRMCN